MSQDAMTRRQHLGELLRQRRRQLGLTQDQVAGSRYSKSFICQLEKGQLDPSLSSLLFLAEQLQLSPADLLGETPASQVNAIDRLRLAATLGLITGRNSEAAACLEEALQLLTEFPAMKRKRPPQLLAALGTECLFLLATLRERAGQSAAESLPLWKEARRLAWCCRHLIPAEYEVFLGSRLASVEAAAAGEEKGKKRAGRKASPKASPRTSPRKTVVRSRVANVVALE